MGSTITTFFASKERGFVMAKNKIESETPPSTTNKGIGGKLDAAGWGLFFIWVGVSALMNLSWGAWLIGVAAIIFLKQTARRFHGRKVERFWLVVGVLFLLGGIWELYQVQVALAPILLIIVGGALLLSLSRRRWRVDRRDGCGWLRTVDPCHHSAWCQPSRSRRTRL